MNKRLLAVLAAGFLAFTSGRAGSPSDVLLAPLRPGMSWTMELAGASSKPPTTSSVSYFEGERTDFIREENSMGRGFRKQVRYFPEGTSFVRYRVEDFILYFDPRTNLVEVDMAGEEAPGGNLSLSGISELQWIAAGNHRGVKELEGVVCDVYSANDQTAMISRATKLPFRREVGGQTWIFRFESRPVVELPPEYKKAVEERKAAIQWRKQRYRISQ